LDAGRAQSHAVESEVLQKHTTAAGSVDANAGVKLIAAMLSRFRPAAARTLVGTCACCRTILSRIVVPGWSVIRLTVFGFRLDIVARYLFPDPSVIVSVRSVPLTTVSSGDIDTVKLAVPGHVPPACGTVTFRPPPSLVHVRWVIWLRGTLGANAAGVQYGTCWLASVSVQNGRATGTVRPFLSAHTVAVAVPDVPISELLLSNEVMSSRSAEGCCATVTHVGKARYRRRLGARAVKHRLRTAAARRVWFEEAGDIGTADRELLTRGQPRGGRRQRPTYRVVLAWRRMNPSRRIHSDTAASRSNEEIVIGAHYPHIGALHAVAERVARIGVEMLALLSATSPSQYGSNVVVMTSGRVARVKSIGASAKMDLMPHGWARPSFRVPAVTTPSPPREWPHETDIAEIHRVDERSRGEPGAGQCLIEVEGPGFSPRRRSSRAVLRWPVEPAERVEDELTTCDGAVVRRQLIVVGVDRVRPVSTPRCSRCWPVPQPAPSYPA